MFALVFATMFGCVRLSLFRHFSPAPQANTLTHLHTHTNSYLSKMFQPKANLSYVWILSPHRCLFFFSLQLVCLLPWLICTPNQHVWFSMFQRQQQPHSHTTRIAISYIFITKYVHVSLFSSKCINIYSRCVCVCVRFCLCKRWKVVVVIYLRSISDYGIVLYGISKQNGNSFWLTRQFHINRTHAKGKKAMEIDDVRCCAENIQSSKEQPLSFDVCSLLKQFRNSHESQFTFFLYLFYSLLLVLSLSLSCFFSITVSRNYCYRLQCMRA